MKSPSARIVLPVISMLFVAMMQPCISMRRVEVLRSIAKKWISVPAIGATLISLSPIAVNMQSAHAFGPKTVELSITSYKPVELCNGQKPIMPGQKAMEGLFPVCIEVEADSKVESSTPLKDVSVYGFVKENLGGNSVLPNNPDFKSDAGQYAMIKTVEPGKSKITYQFVAAVAADVKKGEPLPPLTFFGTKGVAFPGGDKFKPLDACEIDPRAAGCETALEDE